MSRGHGKIEQAILDHMQWVNERSGKDVPTCTLVLAMSVFKASLPLKHDNEPWGGLDDPVHHAKYRSRFQSVRRAIRSLERKGFIDGFRPEGTDGPIWMYRLMT